MYLVGYVLCIFRICLHYPTSCVLFTWWEYLAFCHSILSYGWIHICFTICITFPLNHPDVWYIYHFLWGAYLQLGIYLITHSLFVCFLHFLTENKYLLGGKRCVRVSRKASSTKKLIADFSWRKINVLKISKA